MVERVIRGHIESGSTLGASVLLMRQGRVDLRLCAGEAEAGVPWVEDAILLWLSSGKPVTAIAVAVLLERGLVGLEDLVTKYLPEFGGQGKAGITIRHLLTHTAGLHKSLPAVWEFADWPAILDHICQSALPAGFVPGAMAAYDPAASWFVLGEIIQRITGRSFEAFVREAIFEPCGMSEAGYAYPAERQAELGHRMVRYYNTASGQAHPVAWNTAAGSHVPRPGASLRCSIGEMARFYLGLAEGRVIRPETLLLFTAPSRGKMADKTFGVPMDWGLGIMVNNGPRMPYSFGAQASPGAFGHGGQQSSVVFYDPDTRTLLAAGYNGLCGERQHNLRMGELLDAVFC